MIDPKMSEMQRLFLLTALEHLIECNDETRCWTKPHVMTQEVERTYYRDRPCSEYMGRPVGKDRQRILRGRYTRESAERLQRRGLMRKVTSRPRCGYDLTMSGLEIATELRRAQQLEERQQEWAEWRLGSRKKRPCGGVLLDVRPLKFGDAFEI